MTDRSLWGQRATRRLRNGLQYQLGVPRDGMASSSSRQQFPRGGAQVQEGLVGTPCECTGTLLEKILSPVPTRPQTKRRQTGARAGWGGLMVVDGMLELVPWPEIL